MALRSVSTAPSSANTAPAGSSSGASSGIAALLGAAASTPGTTAPAGTTTPAGATGTTVAGTNGPATSAALNFLQLLTNAAGVATKADPKIAVQRDAKSADSKPPAAAEDQDPNAIAAALALLSQYMSSPPTLSGTPGNTPTPTTQPAASPTTDAAASMAAAATAGSATPTTKSGTPSATDAKAKPGATDSNAKPGSTDDSIKSALTALLAPGTGSEADATAAHTIPATTSDATSSQSSSNSDATSTSSDAIASPLNAQATVSSHVPAQPDTHRADVKSPVGTSAWADELGGKITWMAKQGIESASLRLSPEHLGPVEVHISVQDGATSVMFGATQADTRTALEQALPRLREMFANQGLTLADAGVSREPPRHQTKPAPVAGVSGISAIADDSTSSVTTALPSVRLGLLDTYA